MQRAQTIGIGGGPEEGEGRSVKVSVMPEFFIGREDEIAYAIRRNSDEFDCKNPRHRKAHATLADDTLAGRLNG